MMEILAKVHAKHLLEFGKTHPAAWVLTADLTGSSEADTFRDAYPERYLSMGIAEQNMLAFAGGMAREGLVPLVHTFAVFIYRRAFDQIAMSVAYPNLNVKMFGFLPGVLTPGGATHQAIEDVAVMRGLPTVTIFEPADATEPYSVLDAAWETPGPVYVRQLRGEVPRLFAPDSPLKPFKCRHLRKGADIVIVSSGICTEEAMRASAALADKGLAIDHFHVSTLKPFHYPEITEAIAASKYGAVSIENHSVIGGLGSCIADGMAEAGVGRKLTKVGIQDCFLQGASRRYLMKKFGLDATALIAAVENRVGERFNIAESDLAETYTPAVHSDAKAEAL
jgi:transketolase